MINPIINYKLEKTMLKKILLSTLMCTIMADVSADDPDCHPEVLAPTGYVRDGFDTREWIDSTFWVGNDTGMTATKNQTFTFSCDEARIIISEEDARVGDFAYYQNTFGFSLNDFPTQMAQFEYTVETTDLVNSFAHSDSFTLFRVYADENDHQSVMVNIDMIRIQSLTKPGMKPIVGDYWLMELSFINQKDGSTYIKYHAIEGDEAHVFYRWDGDSKTASSYISVTDVNGEVRYDNKVPDAYTVVPRINRLGLVDSSRPFVIGDQIILKGPMPRNQ